MLLKVKEETTYITAVEFIYNNDTEEWFKNHYGYTIKEWEEDIREDDTSIIEAYLSKQEGTYFVVFNPENTGSMIVYEFESFKK